MRDWSPADPAFNGSVEQMVEPYPATECTMSHPGLSSWNIGVCRILHRESQHQIKARHTGGKKERELTIDIPPQSTTRTSSVPCVINHATH